MNITNLFEQVPYGHMRRFNCIECGGQNSLSITKEKGRVSYNCFKAKCNLSGSRLIKMTNGEARNVLALRKPLEDRREEVRPFSIPTYWIQGLASPRCFQMLLKQNALEAYKLGLFKIAYDPRQDRLCYLIQNTHGSVVGAVGRNLSNQLPKSLNYPDSAKIPFMCGTGDTIVLVEDCASACSIGRFKQFTGVALLGTDLRMDYLLYLIPKFDKIIIALDNDATYKSLKVRKAISDYFKEVTIWTLKKDFKDMNHTEVFEYISNPKKQFYIEM